MNLYNRSSLKQVCETTERHRPRRAFAAANFIDVGAGLWSSSISIFRQMVQFLQYILAPVLYVVRPFSVRSYSVVLSLHYSII